MSAGKGDRPRHKNNAQWDLNYERIFGKDTRPKAKINSPKDVDARAPADKEGARSGT